MAKLSSFSVDEKWNESQQMRQAVCAASFLAEGPQPRWYAVYTAPRHEKRVAEHLNGRCVENYLPLYSSARLWKQRRAVVQLPLFPGYLFTRIHVGDRLLVLEVPGVIRIVGSNGQLTPLPDDTVNALRASLQLRKSQPHPFLTIGKRVRITAGPLVGLEGIILRESRASRMVVSIDSIMRSFSVELEAVDLEAVSPARSQRTHPRCMNAGMHG